MFETSCYLLTCKASGEWIGVLGCLGLLKLIKSSSITSEGCERQVLSKETLGLLSLQSFGLVV